MSLNWLLKYSLPGIILSVAGLAYAEEPNPAPFVGPGGLSNAYQQHRVEPPKLATEAAKPASDNGGSLTQMREWLNQRNQARKSQGIGAAENFNLGKTGSPLVRARKLRKPKLKVPDSMAEKSQADSETTPPEALDGRGSDGRIRHRLLINPNGPDRLQVYTHSGYADADDGEAEKLAKLTSRGKQAWMEGARLRSPDAYFALKPKGWNNPKYRLGKQPPPEPAEQ